MMDENKTSSERLTKGESKSITEIVYETAEIVKKQQDEINKGESKSITEIVYETAEIVKKQQDKINRQELNIEHTENLMRVGWIVVLLMVVSLFFDVIFHKEEKASQINIYGETRLNK